MPTDHVPYRGWPNAVRVSSPHLELVATLDVGPRVLSLKTPDGENVFKNYDEMMGSTGEAEWQIRGGHRFWIAPEDLTRTYFPDNRPVQLTEMGDAHVRLTPPPEDEYGLQKVMELALDADKPLVRVRLTVTNIGNAPTELAPWGPTVMAPGGVEVLPLQPHAPHPGHPKNAKSPADFAPTAELILWPYFTFTDPRYTLGDEFILLRQDAARGPTKIGLAHREGWVAYANRGSLFVKYFDYREGAVYPDRGTRYQTFTNEDMLEMETCGELVTLAPGDSATLDETWGLYECPHAIVTEQDVRDHVLPRIDPALVAAKSAR